jgi:hypothetical protein
MFSVRFTLIADTIGVPSLFARPVLFSFIMTPSDAGVSELPS